MRIISGACTLLFLSHQSHGFQIAPPSNRMVTRVAPSSALASLTEGAAEASSGYAAIQYGPDMEAYAKGFKTAFTEISCSLSTPYVGALPDDLIGTYYRCGPAMFSAGSLLPPKNSLVKPKQPPVPDGTDPSRMVLHPYEGDGAILAMTFQGEGTATTRFRYIRTNAFTNERKKGKKLYTGMESTRSSNVGVGNDFPLPFYRHHLLTGLNKLRKNTSNTRAIFFGKKLLSLWSGGLPYKLDSLALSTDGRSQLGGVIKREESALGGKAAFDAQRNRLLFYGVDEDSGSSQLNIYEFNSKFQPISDNDGAVQVKLPGLALMHDFAITENYAVFVQPALKLNGMQYMLSKEPGKTLTMDVEPSLVHIVARPSNKRAGEIATFQIPTDGATDANLQFVNAFEEQDGTVVFDAIRSDGSNMQGANTRWPWASSLGEYQSLSSKKSLWRYRVHPQNGFISKDCISNDQIYFGVINSDFSGRPHRFMYAAAGALGEDVAPPQGITKYDLNSFTFESWFPESYEFCGEPMYAKRRGDESEDGGYILSVLYNGRDEFSELVVLQASNIGAGPIARVPIGIAVPHGYHGCFASNDDANWTFEEIERRAKLADKMETRGSMWNEVKSDFSGLGLRFDDMEEYFGDLM
mmetsp:Transcript_21490/g.45195  ORF Transcript_21490/g.45195 Transcript_21490/m.45195 type:complete len:637 (-) Transcript_21490:95-2005(-)|eukprot:CAMPEP_0171333054 /NCGR_PEP_ID=MMETSP0878-20121228/3775_1 /TAXON_ID=67004 /ORGANISM="Thalassiosira weissflogii, Strain CCMP1336" /LENGTH=636 /DNA_ID=CAMNT_0011833941 /DNA_START=100 /DNA_END=2010 /DNA_ORIENTATION=-